MGLWADTINTVFDELKDATGAGKNLEYFKNVYFGEQDAVTTLVHPFLWIHLDNPTVDPKFWAAAQDKRQSLFKIVVEIGSEAQDKARPYGVTGSSTQRGPLVAAADVLNEIDSRRSAIIGANSSNVDLETVMRESANVGGRKWGIALILEIKQRYKAGAR